MRTRRLLAIVAIVLVASATASQGRNVGDQERALRELMPAPSRCEFRREEQLVYCRYVTDGVSGVALEINKAGDETAGSLTYGADDVAGRELLSVLRGLMAIEGIEEDAFDECVRDSTMHSLELELGDWRLRCYYLEIFDRITHEVVLLRRQADVDAGGLHSSYSEEDVVR